MKSDDQALVNAAYANVGKAIEAFERTLVAPPAPFDAFAAALASGDDQAAAQAISPAAQRGFRTFLAAGCRNCHSGPRFTDEGFHSNGTPPTAGNDRTLDAGWGTPKCCVRDSAPMGSIQTIGPAIKLGARHPPQGSRTWWAPSERPRCVISSTPARTCMTAPWAAWRRLCGTTTVLTAACSIIMVRHCSSRSVSTRHPNWTWWPSCAHFLAKLTDNPPNLAGKATDESIPADVSAVKNDPKHRFVVSSLAVLLLSGTTLAHEDDPKASRVPIPNTIGAYDETDGPAQRNALGGISEGVLLRSAIPLSGWAMPFQVPIVGATSHPQDASTRWSPCTTACSSMRSPIPVLRRKSGSSLAPTAIGTTSRCTRTTATW